MASMLDQCAPGENLYRGGCLVDPLGHVASMLVARVHWTVSRTIILECVARPNIVRG